MKIRVLTHERNDKIRIGAEVVFDGKGLLAEMADWLAEEYGIEDTHRINIHYKRIAIVDSEDFSSLKEIHNEKIHN